MGFTVLMYSGPRKRNINIFTTRFQEFLKRVGGEWNLTTARHSGRSEHLFRDRL